MLKQLKIKLFQLLKILSKKIIIIFALVILSSSAYSQWTNQNPVPDGNHLRSVFFIDDSTGWMVGSDGFISKTTNAGVDWSLQNSGTSVCLKSIKFIDSGFGFIVGDGGTVLRTVNGGQTWESLITEINLDLNALEFSNPNNVFIVGDEGIILKSFDSGLTWSKDRMKPNYSLSSITFVNENTGWIGSLGDENNYFSDSTYIYKSTDGGSSWFSQSYLAEPGNGTHIHSINFINENVGWIGGGSGLSGFGWNFSILKTTNGGNSWASQDITTEVSKNSNQKDNLEIVDGGGIRDVFFIDENIGWAVGGINTWDRLILSTSDGGNNWIKRSYSSEDYDHYSIYVTSQGKGWTVGGGGSIYLTTDNGKNWIKQAAGSGLLSGDDINSVFFIDRNTGFASGKRDGWQGGGVILKTTDGGSVWLTKAFYNNFSTFNEIFFLDSLNGWSISSDDGLFITIDSGENWNWISSSPTGRSVYFIDTQTGWIVGDRIYKTTDGGLSWNEKNNFGGSSVYFIDELNGWVAGNNGNLLRSVDGGENWVTISLGISTDLSSIKFYNSNIGICTGESGMIYTTIDGGDNWLSKFTGTSSDLKSISIIEQNKIWIAGSDGTILFTSDGGTDWSLVNSITSRDLNSICFIDENNGWVVGEDGTIFKYKLDSVIPVELIGFNNFVSANTVKLTWQTASETNNAGFQVERKKIEDSQNDLWENIRFIEGYGTTSELQSYTYIDDNLIPGKYRYRLKQIDFNGIFEYSNEIEAEIISPKSFALEQNYPNPFNPTTSIQYAIASSQYVQLKVYDILGNEVSTLVNEVKSAGTYQIIFDASDLSSGTYFYRLQAGSFVETKKMILLR
ncbi:MAG: YCF48-related protein [Ignavibacteriaceae bacterium]